MYGLKMSFLRLITLYLTMTFALSQEWNSRDYMKREHSLTQPYQGTGASIPYWDFIGTTFVTSEYVSLTRDQPSSRGAIWNKVPCYVRNWEMQLQFKVHGKAKDLFGDGFAFWYVKEPMHLGDIFGSKDFFTGLGVLVDTYSNHNGPHNHGHPYVSAMINNGSLHYDHDRDGTHTQLAGCVSKFRNVDHDTFLSIKYERDVLSVYTDIENRGAWVECFKVASVTLPTGYYFGVSAATGDLSDQHDVISMKMFDLTTPDDDILEDRSKLSPSASYFEPPRDHAEDPKPSSLSVWKKLFLIIIGVVVICGCVVMGGLFYSKHKEQQRKRFY